MDGSLSHFENEIYIFKAFQILNKAFRLAMVDVFCWGSEKPTDMTVEAYLLSKERASKSRLKRLFTSTQIEKIREDPEGKSFDITLLFRCIQLLCRNIANDADPVWSKANSLENTLLYMKNVRNRMAHEHKNFSEREYLAFADDIKNKIKILYEEAGKRYYIEWETIEERISEANREIANISELDIRTINIDAAGYYYENLVRDQGKMEVKEYLSKNCTIDCSSEIPGLRKIVNVVDFFTDVDLVHKTISNSNTCTSTVKDILNVKTGEDQMPSLIVIEGSQGLGKTTLVKKIISDWCCGTDFIENLKQYDIVLLADPCKPVGSFEEILEMHMPETYQKVKGESFLRAVSNLNVLIIIEDFDEVCRHSYQLFTNIIQLMHRAVNHKMQILITTRQSKKDFFSKMMPKNMKIHVPVYHFEIVGVPQDRFSEFVLKWHCIMCDYGPKGMDVKQLCALIPNIPWCWKPKINPLNLTLLIWLWTQAPKRIELLKTSTTLYNEIVNLMRERLFNRVQESKLQSDVRELKNHLYDCSRLIFRESLNALRHENFSINKTDLVFLNSKCSHQNLPFEDILSTFCAVNEIVDDKNKDLKNVFVPKGFCEFYSALALSDLLKRGNNEEVLQNVITDIHGILISNNLPIGITKRVRKDVQKMLRKNLNKTATILEILKDLHYDKPENFSLLRYQKVLIHLIGVLKLQNSLSQQYVIELVDLLMETNLTDSEQWLDILTETDCEVSIIEKVTEVISKNNHLYIKDGNLRAAACVLQTSEFEYVNINIFSDPGKMKFIKPVLKALSASKTRIHLSLLHHWHYPEQGWSDDFLRCLLGKNKPKLTHFKGSVKSLSSLSNEIDVLFVALGTHYAKHADRTPDFICKSLANIEQLYIHVTGGIDVECLPDLPKKYFHVDLWFSEIDDTLVDWVGSAVEKLSFKFRPFWSIRFPRSTLTADGCIKLAKILKGKALFGKDGIIISSEHIPQDEIKRLKEVFLSEIRCSCRLLDGVRVWSLLP